MSRHLLRTAMVMGIAALAFSFAGTVRAEDTSTSTNAPATAPAPKPKRHQFTGIVESIDAKAGTAIVKKDTESKTFKIGEKTKYSTVDKKEAAVTDIKVGDKVLVSYTEEGGALIAHKIGVPAVPAKKEKEKEAPKN
jgi:Cu/Ag efflux protein CusF